MELWQKVFVKTSIGWQKGLFVRKRGNDLEIMVVTQRGLPYEAIPRQAGDMATVFVIPSNVRIFDNPEDAQTWLTK